MGDQSLEAQGRRLRQARELRYDTAREAAGALGLPEQTYAPYEQGKTGYWRHARRFAEKFGVNVIWLLWGDGPMKKGQKAPILELLERVPPEKHQQVIDFIEFQASKKD